MSNNDRYHSPRVPRSDDRMNERPLCRHLKMFFDYHHHSRTHLHWRRTARSPTACNRPMLVGSSRSRKSVDCIIGTSAGPPDYSKLRRELLWFCA